MQQIPFIPEKNVIPGPILIAGIDDATKCPCIGSIFIAGVLADEATIEEWKKIGVKDSKLLSAKKREKLAFIIKKTAKAFAIQQIAPSMIDDKQIFNLNDWEMLVVLNVTKQLTRNHIPEKVYIDNWETSTQGFKNRLEKLLAPALKKDLREKHFILNRKKLLSLNFIAEHRADETYTIVGAASILAKTSSDAQFRKYKRKFGDFGSGNPGDFKTRLFVWQHRHNPLPIIRTSWNTFKTLVSLDSIEQDPLRQKKNISS